MDTKSYLKQIERLDRTIQNKLSEIYHLKTIACNITVSNDTERVQTSSDKDRLGSVMAKIIDLEKETDALVDDFIAKRRHIINQIDGMEDVDMYHVLSSRYVGRKTFEDIAKNIDYTKRQVLRIHGNALIEFEKKYGNEYLSEK